MSKSLYTNSDGLQVILAWVFVLVLIINNSFFYNIQAIYYGLLILIWFIAFIYFVASKRFKVSIVIVFLFAIYLSILINDVSNIFKPYERAIGLTILITLLGPIFTNDWLYRFRVRIFSIFIVLNMAICSISYLLMILGLHNGKKISLLYNVERLDFAGLYGHSMILAPLSAISVLSCIFYYNKFKNEDKLSFDKKCLLILVALLSLFSCVQSGSRNALLGFLLAILYYIYELTGRKISKLTLILIFILTVSIVTFPIYEANLDYLFLKFDSYNHGGSLTESRDGKWINRINEFISSPLFGIGYPSVDLNTKDYGDEGVVETGSSWLGFLSMTGLLGFLPLFVYCIRIFILKIIVKTSKTGFSTFIYSIFFIVIINMVFEGSALASGTIVSAMIWLIFGLVEGLEYSKTNL